jgi:hypothetical protein
MGNVCHTPGFTTNAPPGWLELELMKIPVTVTCVDASRNSIAAKVKNIKFEQGRFLFQVGNGLDG